MAAAVAGLLTACAATYDNPFVVRTEQITIERQAFIRTYEDLKTLYLRFRPVAVDLCTRGVVTPARCVAMAEADGTLRRVDLEIQTIIRNPEVRPNWPLIGKMVGALAGAVL